MRVIYLTHRKLTVLVAGPVHRGVQGKCIRTGYKMFVGQIVLT
jgi:hypothetical protein